MKKQLFFTALLAGFMSVFGQTHQVDSQGKEFFTGGSQLMPAQISSFRATSVNWGPQENVSNTPNLNSWYNSMAVGSDNIPHIAFLDFNDADKQKIKYVTKSGNSWTTPLIVDTGGILETLNTTNPTVAVSPNGDVHVIYSVWSYDGNSRYYIGYSKFDKETNLWSPTLKLSEPKGGIANTTGVKNIVYSTSNNLPVVAWQKDNRSGKDECYMKYFDGTNWSADLPISEIGDNYNSIDLQIVSLGNQKSMFLYSEYISATVKELRYRIYDEVTHALSTPKIINLDTSTYPSNLILARNGTGIANLLYAVKVNNTTQNIKVAQYNFATDSFSTNPHIATITGPNFNWTYGMDCNISGDCAIAYTSYGQNIFYTNFRVDSGFSTPEIAVVTSSEPGRTPVIEYDEVGNLHLNWVDNSLGLTKGEIFYKTNATGLGTTETTKSDVKIYPNPSDGNFTLSALKPYDVEIVDMTGKVVHKSESKGTANLHLKLAKGIYLVKLSNKTDVITKKLIIK